MTGNLLHSLKITPGAQDLHNPHIHSGAASDVHVHESSVLLVVNVYCITLLSLAATIAI